jgi:hypothetical protein
VSGTRARPQGGPFCFFIGSTLLAHGNGLGLSGSQTLSAIVGNGAVDDGAAINAFPGIEDEKEIREPL